MILSCPGHPFITASADRFTLVKYVIIIIVLLGQTNDDKTITLSKDSDIDAGIWKSDIDL